MAIRKYTNGAWVPAGRKYGTETDTITSLPAQIIGDGQPITSCQISGNTVQNGTPTPDAPVDVVGCGVRTGNLFDKTTVIIGKRVVTNGESIDENKAHSDYIDLSGINAISVSSDIGESTNIYFYSSKTNTADSYARGRTASVPQGAKYCRVNMSVNDINTFMLNAGSTPLQYEPYGFKLPLTCGGTEYPIYLGQVQTTRRIRKLVLKGDDTETYVSSYSGDNRFFTYVLGSSGYDIIISTHFTRADISSKSTYVGVRIINPADLRIRPENVRDMTVDGFKAWLSAQYANGTPVTVWFVLATPETGIVNEPLMKIGDYADTVSATNIPTTGTPENFDVLTTLKPSEVQLTYHGWHEHTDTKYTQGE